jgi:hypothetical protein
MHDDEDEDGDFVWGIDASSDDKQVHKLHQPSSENSAKYVPHPHAPAPPFPSGAAKRRRLLNEVRECCHWGPGLSLLS